MSPLTAVYDELARLQRIQHRVLALAFVVVVGFAAFALYEVIELRQQQQRLSELNKDLCGTLGRAGIILQGTKENPCERLPRSPSSLP